MHRSRQQLLQDVQYLSIPELQNVGVRHGWFMRYGGVSDGKYSSLNGKKGAGDFDERVDENRNRAALQLTQQENTKTTHIIHSFEDRVLVAAKSGEFQSYDAAVSTHQSLLLSQTTADCASSIIGSTAKDVVAIIHGSWHTLKKDIIMQTIQKVSSQTAGTLIAGIGPMICRNCYEFGSEATDLFPPRYIHSKKGKLYVDLNSIVKDQLKSSGVKHVIDLNICTKEDDRFFSHRKDGAESGRFLTLAGLTDVL